MKQEELEKKFNTFKEGYSQEDADKVLNNQNEIENIVKRKEKLQEFCDEIKNFFQLLKDFFSGKYKEVPVGKIATIIGTLLYIPLPLDLIPDLLPVIGFADDAGIITLCIKFTKDVIDAYKKYKSSLESE